MIQIPIDSLPNQSLSITLDNNVYDLVIHSCESNINNITGIVACDLTINGTVTVTGLRAIPSFPIIPSQYLENGNFIFQTENDAYPDWRQFGITQFLIYASQEELNAIRGIS